MEIGISRGGLFVTVPFFVGCYGDENRDTIVSYSFDPQTETITPRFLHKGLANASYLCRKGNVLYSVSEGDPSAVAVFSIEEHGLTERQRVSFAEGGACHLMFCESASRLFVSCYGTGCDVIFAVNEDGTLIETPSVNRHIECNPSHPRQRVPHAHCCAMTTNPYRMVSVDLGGDVVTVNNMMPSGTATILRECSRLTLPKGSGPRHIVFSQMELAYLLTELSNEIYKVDFHAGSGSLWIKDVAPTLPDGFSGKNTASAIKISPDERHLAVSNRGDDSVMIYDIGSDGSLQNGVCNKAGGKCPRDLAFSPDGKYVFVCCQASDLLTVHRFDEERNTLSPVASASLPSPACVIF